jgi:hypothetical protein
LPQVVAFVVFFRPERRMMKVFEQQEQLLVESPLNRFGCLTVIANEMFWSGEASSGPALRFPRAELAGFLMQ